VNLLGSGTSVPHYGEAKASLPIKFHLFLVSEIIGKKLKLVPFASVNESPLFLSKLTYLNYCNIICKNSMASTQLKAEKITIAVPHELEEELHASISSLHKDAMQSYIKQKEIERWERAAAEASKDKDYMNFVEEVSDTGDIYEY